MMCFSFELHHWKRRVCQGLIAPMPSSTAANPINQPKNGMAASAVTITAPSRLVNAKVKTLLGSWPRRRCQAICPIA